jgi:hypothetical protein
MKSQRYLYHKGRLGVEQIEMLNVIGFEWKINKKSCSKRTLTMESRVPNGNGEQNFLNVSLLWMHNDNSMDKFFDLLFYDSGGIQCIVSAR